MGELVNFKITGEYITKWIRTLYFVENTKLDYCKNKLIKLLMMDNSLDKEKVAEDIILGEKKLVGENELYLERDNEFDVYNYCYISRPILKSGEGITGILTRDGLFAQCNYGEHNETIKMLGNKSSGALIFSSSDKGSYVIKDKQNDSLSSNQIKWLEKNYEYLDNVQRDLTDGYKRGYC